MINPILQLSAGDLASALDGIQPIDVLAEELAGRGATSVPTARMRRWPGGADGDLVLLEDSINGTQCVLPATGLLACRAAALTGLAARHLLAEGADTAAVLASDVPAEPHLAVIARYLRGLSRITLCAPEDRHGHLVERSVLDQIDLAGIRLAIVAAVDDAVAGAGLVVATRPERIDVGMLAGGALVVNATNRDLPDELIDSVNQLYVDDARRLDDSPDRYFVRRAKDGRGRIDADLGHLLTGAHPGRTESDHIVLVELLSANVLDIRLAGLLYRAAVERGLGHQLFG
jgi:ornithine cyclodeaminase/alanine dehydrogenase-like protein (mu-crystallin family)